MIFFKAILFNNKKDKKSYAQESVHITRVSFVENFLVVCLRISPFKKWGEGISESFHFVHYSEKLGQLSNRFVADLQETQMATKRGDDHKDEGVVAENEEEIPANK